MNSLKEERPRPRPIALTRRTGFDDGFGAQFQRVLATYCVCQEFGFDDGPPIVTRSFLYADYAVECDLEEHKSLKRLASGLIVLWPVGWPVLFAALLFASRTTARWAPELSRAVSFLHVEYKPTLFYWELVEVMRKRAWLV